MIKKLAKTYGIRVKVIRKASDKDLIDFYNRARLCLFVPVNEPFGLIPLEAMACGLPVVGIDEGGVTETMKESRGWLAKRNPKTFSQAIIKALESKLAHKDSLELKDYVGRFWNWDKGARKLEKILREASRL